MRAAGFLLYFCVMLHSRVEVGLERIAEKEFCSLFQGKKIGLITNHTAITGRFETIFDVFGSPKLGCQVTAVFAPEHGIDGLFYADHHVKDEKKQTFQIYSLYGKTRRPTGEMLDSVNLLVFDIQDIGCRSYTYATTLFYCMEAAQERKIPIVVLDRPNPLGGNLVDGFFVEEKLRAFNSYLNVPFCHGMTIGELARYFNAEYKVGAALTVIPMRGWNRSMTFVETGLPWVPTSPNVPERDTPFYYAATAAFGELSFVNIGVGYTLPFKVVGAPWIDSAQYRKVLQEQHLPGVTFAEIHFCPFFGLFKGEKCHGVQIHITDPAVFKPIETQCFLFGILKSLYPDRVLEGLKKAGAQKIRLFSQAVGTEHMIELIQTEKHVAWKLCKYQQGEREAFKERRRRYLIYL